MMDKSVFKPRTTVRTKAFLVFKLYCVAKSLQFPLKIQVNEIKTMHKGGISKKQWNYRDKIPHLIKKFIKTDYLPSTELLVDS